jgi:hypothetical protein
MPRLLSAPLRSTALVALGVTAAFIGTLAHRTRNSDSQFAGREAAAAAVAGQAFGDWHGGESDAGEFRGIDLTQVSAR